MPLANDFACPNGGGGACDGAGGVPHGGGGENEFKRLRIAFGGAVST